MPFPPALPQLNWSSDLVEGGCGTREVCLLKVDKVRHLASLLSYLALSSLGSVSPLTSSSSSWVPYFRDGLVSFSFMFLFLSCVLCIFIALPPPLSLFLLLSHFYFFISPLLVSNSLYLFLSHPASLSNPLFTSSHLGLFSFQLFITATESWESWNTKVGTIHTWTRSFVRVPGEAIGPQSTLCNGQEYP